MKDENGDTSLTISCEKGNLNVIKLLINRGAKTDICNSTGNSPLNIICKKESEKSLKIINYLIKHVNMNIKDKNGNTALLIACYFRNNKIIEKLLEKNETKINIQNVFDDTPLIISSYFKNGDIKKELKKKGADIDLKNKYGKDYKNISKIDKGKKLIDKNILCEGYYFI